MPVSAFLAGLPILVILALMLGRRWSAARAGVTGVGVSLAVAVFVFDFPRPLGPEVDLGPALGGVSAESGFTALTILWIIGPALGIHQLQLRTGGAEVLREALGRFAPDPRILALLVAWFFVLFMEGAAGFGASVALAAPFLVAAGFRPVEAVTITLVGHVVGVSFGAVGTPVIPQVAVTGLSGLEIARATGLYHSLLGWIPLVVMVGMVGRAVPEKGSGSTGGIWAWTAAAYVCFLVPYTILWAWVGPELPTMAGALFGGMLFLLLLRVVGGLREGSDAGGRDAAPVDDGPSGKAVLRASAPYLVLVALVLLSRLVPPLRDLLQTPTWAWEWEGTFAGSIQPLYHPGTMLLLGFVVGAWLQRTSRTVITGAVVEATRTLVPVAVALVAMLALSRVMVHAGMTEVLAATAAEGAGSRWPVFAPFVGMLGTFVTGSATASNILFTDFQQSTARTVGLPVMDTVGTQGFGAAVGNMVCPHNVVAAGATVGLQGREGEILRRTLWVALLYTGAGGALALWLSS